MPNDRSIPSFCTAQPGRKTAPLRGLNSRSVQDFGLLIRPISGAYRAGIVTRADLFQQTKFTYRRGQDDQLPYDPAANLGTQVAQSLASSLDHLATDHVDRI